MCHLLICIIAELKYKIKKYPVAFQVQYGGNETTASAGKEMVNRPTGKIVTCR